MYTAPGFLCRAAGKAGVSEHAVLPLKGSHDCSAACIKRHRARSNGGPDSFTLKQTTPLLSRHISAAAAVAAVRGQSRNSAQRRLIESHQNNAFARPLLISIPSLSFPGLTVLGLDTARGTTTQLERHLASRIAHPPLSPPSCLSLAAAAAADNPSKQPPPSHPTSADHHSRDYSASVQSTFGGHTRARQCQSSNRIPEVVFFNTCSI